MVVRNRLAVDTANVVVAADYIIAARAKLDRVPWLISATAS